MSQPVAVVLGPRQAGKSSVLEHLSCADRRQVTLDDFATRAAAIEDPKLFIDSLGDTLLIDEAQYAPPLFPELKRRVDEFKRVRRGGREPKALSFWLTGSNRIAIDASVTESLAGRASYFRFYPLSARELANSFGKVAFAQLLERGGWPELWANEALPFAPYLNDLLQTTLEKDLVRSAGIEKADAFLRMVRLTAGRLGGLFVASEIGRDAGVHASTVADWRNFLERMMHVVVVEPFLRSRSQRIIKASKVFFLDVALAARLQGWTSSEPILSSPAVGGLFETLVASEIVKTRDTFQKNWELTHFRTKEGEEVDFVVSDARHHVAVECKFSARAATLASIPRALLKDDISHFLSVSYDEPSRFKGRATVGEARPVPTQACSVFELGDRLLQLLD